MFKWVIILFIMTNSMLYCGEIKSGSVPGSIVYQGRVEKDNAPLTGLMHIIFRIYKYQTGGTPLWTSDEFLVEARGGIFSVSFEPPLYIFAGGSQLYLEVEIEGEKLSPREPINSVIYALVAKKLEDGAFVHFSSITIGTNPNVIPPSGQRAVILNGGIYTDRVCFLDNSCMSTSGGSSAVNEVFSPGDVYLRSDSDNNNTGSIIFQTSTTYKGIITNDGRWGVGTQNPSARLEVAGDLKVSSNAVFGGSLLLSGILNNGVLKGNNSQISLGVNTNEIDFVINSSTYVTISGGMVGIGKTPTKELDVAGDIGANNLSASGTINTSSLNTQSISGLKEITSSYDIVIQNQNIYKVGIGTDTPKEKLHVGGNLMVDKAIIASSATFNSNVNIGGNLDVSNFGSKVNLSSTTVYGVLDVKGSFTLNNQAIAGLSSTQTFTGQNSFIGQITISSDVILTYNNARLGVGANSFSYPGQSYLQIGDQSISNSQAMVYLSAGPGGDGKVNFYRGSLKIGAIGTSGNNLQLFFGPSDNSRLYIDDSYFKIYNSTLIISPSQNDLAPAIYVNKNSMVGIGTNNPNYPLTVSGSIKIEGSGNGIIFNDGTIINSSSSISVGAVSNNQDVLILADADKDGSGNILLNIANNPVVFVSNDGKVGIGTTFPSQKLQVKGGDVVIGDIIDPYSGDLKEDLIVKGNLVVGGSIEQYSPVPVNFTSLYVTQNVYLSTAPGYNTGVGTLNPQAKLDVNGNANFSQGITASSATFTQTGTYSILSSSGIKITSGILDMNNNSIINMGINSVGSYQIMDSTITDADISPAANISWTKISKTGSSLADLTTRSASDLTSGNLDIARMPTGGNWDIASNLTIAGSTFAITTTGNVGIGTTSPIRKLDLVNDVSGLSFEAGTGSPNSGVIRFGDNTGWKLHFGRSRDSGGGPLNSGMAGVLMTIQDNGNVGIGTTNPGSKFEVYGGSVVVKSGGNDALVISTGTALGDGSEVMVVKSNGNAGIGTTNPGAKLDVNGNANFSQGITASSATFTQTGTYSILSSSGIKITSGILDMNNNLIKNLYDPSDPQDAATKNYVDNQVGGSILTAWLIGGNSLTSSSKFGDKSASGRDVIFIRQGYEMMRLSDGVISISSTVISNKDITASSITVTGNSFSIGISTFVVFQGNVGIGTTGPGAKLDVVGGLIRGNSGLSITGGSISLPNDSITPAYIQQGVAGQILMTNGTPDTAWVTISGDATLSSAGVLKISSGVITSALILDGTITDADISPTANISWTKMNGVAPIASGGTNNSSFTTGRPIIYDGAKLASFSGFNGSFTVAVSTNPAQGCMQLNYQYGVLSSTQSVSCP